MVVVPILSTFPSECKIAIIQERARQVSVHHLNLINAKPVATVFQKRLITFRPAISVMSKQKLSKYEIHIDVDSDLELDQFFLSTQLYP